MQEQLGGKTSEAVVKTDVISAIHFNGQEEEAGEILNRMSKSSK